MLWAVAHSPYSSLLLIAFALMYGRRPVYCQYCCAAGNEHLDASASASANVDVEKKLKDLEKLSPHLNKISIDQSIPITLYRQRLALWSTSPSSFSQLARHMYKPLVILIYFPAVLYDGTACGFITANITMTITTYSDWMPSALYNFSCRVRTNGPSIVRWKCSHGRIVWSIESTLQLARTRRARMNDVFIGEQIQSTGAPDVGNDIQASTGKNSVRCSRTRRSILKSLSDLPEKERRRINNARWQQKCELSQLKTRPRSSP